MTLKGKLIASAVAGLFSMMASPAFAAEEKDTDQVKCGGINSCKGKGGCAGAANSCAGQNACKGQAWVKSSRKECKDKGGKVVGMADDKGEKKPDKK